MDETKTRLRALIVKALQLQIDPTDVKDTNLVTSLGIDSIGALEIIVQVENAFRISIDDADASPALVDSLDTLAAYIISKQKDRQGPGAQM
jgi:acyl carrier protein